jgi:glutaconyl-CoA/methylmalonyl-CoA decarboxylase subunit delta
MIPTEIFQISNIGVNHLIIVGVGYMVVFLSLSMLWVVFSNIPALLNFKWPKSKPKETKAVEKIIMEDNLTGEESAAISAAIFLFINELHDEENTVLTIQKISKRYSPWNSKIYNVTNGLNKRF